MEETEVEWAPLVMKLLREENLTLLNICLLFQAETSILVLSKHRQMIEDQAINHYHV